MAIIHKLVESGAEAYLPFLLAREREIRRKRSDNSDGSMSGGYAVKYELGDGIEGELRMVGNQSFISLRMVANIGFEWLSYPCKIAPVVFESAAHATTPVEDGPIVEKLPFVPIPNVPPPPAPVLRQVSKPVRTITGLGPPTPIPPCTSGGFPMSTPLGNNMATVKGYPDYGDTCLGRAESSGIGEFMALQYLADLDPVQTTGNVAAVFEDYQCQGYTTVRVNSYRFGPWWAVENTSFDYVSARHAADVAYQSEATAYAAALEDNRMVNAAIDLQNNTRLQLWMGENDAPMVAKKNAECDAWDAPKRPIRKAFMEALFIKVLAEVEAGFTTKWVTKTVLSPEYIPTGPLAPEYFIRKVSSSTSYDALERRTDTYVYGITGPDGVEREVNGSKRDVGYYGPSSECFTLNGDEGLFRVYDLSNFWLGDPADGVPDLLPSSTSRARGYLVTGSTPTRQDNKFLYADLNEITLPEAVAFDSSPAPALPHITSDGRRMLDMGFVDGCSVSIIVLRYMMWDAVSNARVPVVGYTETRARFWCRQGNCLDSNFVSRSSPRNAANEVWLESVVTMTKTNSQWSAPIVTKHPGVFLCPIAVDNTPTKRPGGDLPGDVPYANFPDFVVVVRGMPASYGPAVNELATAFTDKFFSLDTTDSSVPPATECTTVAQMRDRITLEAIKQSNL